MTAESDNTIVIPSSAPKLAKALWGVAIGLGTVAVAIFGAGSYSANMVIDIKDYRNKIDKAVVEIAALKEQNEALKRSINTQFDRLGSLENSEPFKNDSTNGAGYVASKPPGRCQPNEVVVGIQPLERGSGIVMQCGRLPSLKLN